MRFDPVTPILDQSFHRLRAESSVTSQKSPLTRWIRFLLRPADGREAIAPCLILPKGDLLQHSRKHKLAVVRISRSFILVPHPL